MPITIIFIFNCTLFSLYFCLVSFIFLLFLILYIILHMLIAQSCKVCTFFSHSVHVFNTKNNSKIDPYLLSSRINRVS